MSAHDHPHEHPHCNDGCGHDHQHAAPATAAPACADGCNHDFSEAAQSPRYRRVLWIALWLNAAMFFVEMIGGWGAHSSALLADAVDFAGDAGNYALGIYAISLGAVWRSRTAWFKGATMAAYGAAVLGVTLWRLAQGVVPEPATMGVIGTLALATNFGVAVLLYAFRNGDAQMRSVWLCTRNDAIGNVAVLLAALGVFGTGTAWPDLAVAGFMSVLAMRSGWAVMRAAQGELSSHAAPAVAPQHGHQHARQHTHHHHG